MKRLVILLFFLVWPLAGAYLSFHFALNALLSPFVFYAVPALILSSFRPSYILSTLVISLFALPYMVIIDYIAERTKAWQWPLPYSIIPLRLFSFVSLEVLLWAYLHVYVVVLFYRYFFGKNKQIALWNKRSQLLASVTGLLFLLFLVVLVVNNKLLNIPYWYLVFGVICILPFAIIGISKYRSDFKKLLNVSFYFFYVNLVYEITALKIGWWSFPSKQFIGYISLFNTTFPFEEFFFWICLLSFAILTAYRFFFEKS